MALYNRRLAGKTGAVTRKRRAFENAQIRLTDGGNGGKIKTEHDIVPLSQLNLKIRSEKQKQHILGTKQWLRESKRLLAEGENPKSFLYKNVDAQKLVDKYATKVEPYYRKSSKYPILYVLCDRVVGKTFDKKVGKYVETRKIAIVHSSKGPHVYPVIERM